jgi:hypothetical protein
MQQTLAFNPPERTVLLLPLQIIVFNDRRYSDLRPHVDLRRDVSVPGISWILTLFPRLLPSRTYSTPSSLGNHRLQPSFVIHELPPLALTNSVANLRSLLRILP